MHRLYRHGQRRQQPLMISAATPAIFILLEGMKSRQIIAAIDTARISSPCAPRDSYALAQNKDDGDTARAVGCLHGHESPMLSYYRPAAWRS